MRAIEVNVLHGKRRLINIEQIVSVDEGVRGVDIWTTRGNVEVKEDYETVLNLLREVRLLSVRYTPPSQRDHEVQARQ